MKRLLIALIVALFATACGGGADHTGHGDQHSHGTVPGAAAHPSAADRKITVIASDDLAFDPASIQVEQGEVITFVIKNEGSAVHEFVLGDEAYQASHEEHMADQGGHGGMQMGSGAVTIKPGKTATVTWQFTDAGEVLYGCHEPGHYDGGMVGTIEVS